jgi:serine/threonine-protein kinase
MSWRGSTEHDDDDGDETLRRSIALELVIVTPLENGRAVPVARGKLTIGSGGNCDVVIAQPSVLPVHLVIDHRLDDSLWVGAADKSPVWVNGSALLGWQQLTPGGFLRLGDVELVLRERNTDSSPFGTLKAPTPLRSPPMVLSRSGRHAAPDDGGIAGTVRRPSGVEPARPSPPGHQPTLEAPVEGRSDLEAGTVIAGRYRIMSRLAAGGMGEVYQVQHVDLVRVFALKVMRPELSKDPEFADRFKREAVASGQIGHRNIVDITDFGRTDDGRLFFVMEFLDGRTLASIISRQGAQPVPRVLHLAIQMCWALGAAHKRGITHRDLKPENVMVLERDGEGDLVKIVDLGVAKVTSGHAAGGQTAIGMVVGTPQYMAPEQAAGLSVDARSDIYSLGLVLYELLTGRQTFKGETPSILMSMQMTAPPPPMVPGPVSLPLPVKLEKLVLQMLGKKPAERPQTTDEVLAVLVEVQREGSTSPSAVIPAPALQGPRDSGALPVPLAPAPAPVPGSGVRFPSGEPAATAEPTPSRRSPVGLVLAVVLGALAVIGAATLLLRSSDPPPAPMVVVPAPESPRAAEAPAVPPAPAVVPPVKTVIITLPEKAAVYEGSIYVGTTPLSLTREAGAVVELRFQARGFQELTQRVQFTPDMPAVELQLQHETVRAPKKRQPTELHDDPYKQENDLKDMPDP